LTFASLLAAHFLKPASLLAAAAVGASPWPASGASPWSPPATLSACPAANAAARVAFPSDSPSHATGAGAIVWDASSACPGGEGARVAALGAGDLPAPSAIPTAADGHALAPRGPLVASGAPRGQIAIAGGSPLARGDGLLVQGPSGGPFAPLQIGAGSTTPMALATAYLGDLALLAAQPAGAGSLADTGTRAGAVTRAGAGTGPLEVHVERFFAHAFARNAPVAGAGGGTVQALTLALDYRGEALAVWAQRGTIYARVVPSVGDARPLQRLAPAGARLRIAALLSDDGRATVAWAERLGGETSVYLDRSSTGMRFRAPELLERFSDPDGLPSPPGSPSLVRLSSESVMLAWAGAAGGHWVVRTAPIDLHGLRTVSTIAPAGTDALFADLAAGPADDALLLWTEPTPSASGSPDMDRQALFAARGADARSGRTAFDEPQQLTPPARVSDATAALDPSSNRAVAVWRGDGGTIEYSIGSADTQSASAFP